MFASVILPCRNRAEILPHTLRALARQSLPPNRFEVVVVDDSSTDGTEERLREESFPFRLVYERLSTGKEFCPARPRNHGLRIAGGEIAIFLDAEMLAGQELVAAHLAAHAAVDSPLGVIGYTYGYPSDAAERTPERMAAPPPEEVLDCLPRLLNQEGERWRDGREQLYRCTRDLEDCPTPWEAFWTCNVSVPRLLALETGGFDETFVGWGGEDFEFAYRLHNRGARFQLARDAWGVHYPHPVGDLTLRHAEMERNRRRIIEKHPSLLLELQLSDWGGWQESWRHVQRLLAESPTVCEESGEEMGAVEDYLRKEVFSPGPLLWCGPSDARIAQRLQPVASCVPFGAKDEDAVLPNAHPLLGIFTPWDTGTFAGCVVADYWRSLTPVLIERIVSETTRIAPCAALLCSEERHSRKGGAGLFSLAACQETLAALPSEYEWAQVEQGGRTAFLVRRALQGRSVRPVLPASAA